VSPQCVTYSVRRVASLWQQSEATVIVDVPHIAAAPAAALVNDGGPTR